MYLRASGPSFPRLGSGSLEKGRVIHLIKPEEAKGQLAKAQRHTDRTIGITCVSLPTMLPDISYRLRSNVLAVVVTEDRKRYEQDFDGPTQTELKPRETWPDKRLPSTRYGANAMSFRIAICG